MRRALLLPPDLHSSAGVVARDLLRQAGAVRLAARAGACGAAAETTLVDAGDRGTTAAETAARVAAFCPDVVELFVPRTHARAGRVLSGALAAAGLDLVEHVVADVDAPAHGLAVPTAGDEGWIEQIEADVEIVLAAVGDGPVHDSIASPFSPALHLGDDRWLDLLSTRVAAVLPRAAPEWRTLLHAHYARVSPLEAVYAGLHLRDRNAELLVNIL